MISKGLFRIIQRKSLKEGYFQCIIRQMAIKPTFNERDAQEFLLAKTIEKAENNAEAINWDEVKTNVIKSGRRVNVNNIDAMTLAMCINYNCLKAGKAYFQYLNDSDQQLNLATVGKFLRLFYALKKADLATRVDETAALDLYDKMRAKYQLLDVSTAEQAVYALTQTARWKESIELFEMIKITASPGVNVYSSIIEAAFSYDDHKLGWELLEHMLEIEDKTPSDGAYVACIDNYACKSLPNCERVMNLFADFDVRPSKIVIDALANAGKALGFEPIYAKINKMSLCENCDTKMQKVDLTSKEFNLLKSTIIDKVIVGKNVYLKTNPEELAKFDNFVDAARGKYNVVIDGLNVAYSAGARQTPKIYALFLEAVVKHWLDRGKTPLVLGRAHMAKWPMAFVKKNTYMFLAQNISQDDPLLLYCALSGELGTQIVSRDMMRSHAYLLKDINLKRLFRRWLLQSRHEVLHVDTHTKKVYFKFPPLYLPSAQKCDGHWHIPYVQDENTQNEATPKSWLCLRNSSLMK